ncbi:MAG: tRNA (adenosine(37)-N6)-dimethylallyltransferase MiaA [Proteobacteria bacterium]|uniref:tRNA (adenosine(37)-N6)-dimethylallyltransferase MiaA n=1 Tax=Aquabacterium sp. TaxID=1872578 RepID=UPI0035C707A7|nr:tRNA (adenosine(37)-N6)-dimethylallyltransferase MiaA [Pseudomonadota bacterium]
MPPDAALHPATAAPLWVLTGPTACGKTAVALALAAQCAQAQGGSAIEVLSVDSALIYRGMDIGTAKPSAAEMAQVPHHLIDIVDASERYSAARFVADALAAVADIRARGRTPLLVGGTMLYLKALLEGMDEMPAIPPEVRAEVDARMKAQGSLALHAELQQVDPVTAARLAPGDTQRIQRAIEVWAATGQPLSAFQRKLQGVDADAATATQPPGSAGVPAIVVSLEPQDRAWLHRRVALRFEQMMATGFIDEVVRLRARGDLDIDLPSMRCVGYRQVWEALDAGLDLHDQRTLAEVTERGIAATRQLAKRQVTWLRGMPQRHVLACDSGLSAEALAAQARDIFTTAQPARPSA